MYDRNPRFPLEIENRTVELASNDDVEELVEHLTSEVVIMEHVDQLSRMQDAIFSKVEQNILAAQEKQTKQFKEKTGCPYAHLRSMVLCCNVICYKKTKKV